ASHIGKSLLVVKGGGQHATDFGEKLLLCLDTLVFGQIGKHPQSTTDLASTISYRTGTSKHRERITIFAAKAEFKLLEGALQIAANTFLSEWDIFRKDELRNCIADQFLDRIAKHFRHAVVDEERLGLGINEPDAFVGRLDDGTVLLLIFSLTLLALGDIAIDFHDSNRSRVSTAYHHLTALDDDLFSIFAHMDQFPFPLCPCCQKLIKDLARVGKPGMEERVCDAANGFLCTPAIELLR